MVVWSTQNWFRRILWPGPKACTKWLSVVTQELTGLSKIICINISSPLLPFRVLKSASPSEHFVIPTSENLRWIWISCCSTCIVKLSPVTSSKDLGEFASPTIEQIGLADSARSKTCPSGQHFVTCNEIKVVLDMKIAHRHFCCLYLSEDDGNRKKTQKKLVHHR